MSGNLKYLVLSLALAVGLSVAPAVTPSPAAPPASAASAAGADDYWVNVASFNILSSMVARGGESRAHRAAVALQESGSQVVAFQEVSAQQLPILRTRMPGFAFYPRRSLGNFSSAIQIAWKRSLFTKVRRGAIYRSFIGRLRAIPWVQLRDNRTGRTFFVIALHNSPGGLESERDASTVKEIALIRRLRTVAGTREKPIFVMGDTNERQELCLRVNRATKLISMGGTRTRPCPVPRRAGPDWLLGDPYRVSYRGYAKRYNGISDHPMVVARAHVWPARG